jgi:hypothetical protein
LATLPLNRYAGVSCSRHLPGILETPLIECDEAKSITLNADVSRGKIVVKIVYLGSVHDLGVLQAGDWTEKKFKLPIFLGKFRLRFSISDAELFGFTLTK